MLGVFVLVLGVFVLVLGVFVIGVFQASDLQDKGWEFGEFLKKFVKSF